MLACMPTLLLDIAAAPSYACRRMSSIGSPSFDIMLMMQSALANDRASKSPDFSGDLPIFDKIMKISRSPDLE